MTVFIHIETLASGEQDGDDITYPAAISYTPGMSMKQVALVLLSVVDSLFPEDPDGEE